MARGTRSTWDLDKVFNARNAYNKARKVSNKLRKEADKADKVTDGLYQAYSAVKEEFLREGTD